MCGLPEAQTGQGLANGRRLQTGWGALAPLGVLLLLALALAGSSGAAQGAEPEALKLTVEVDDQTVAAPFPIRVTLRLHNSGQTALWLYRHVRDQEADAQSKLNGAELSEKPGNYTSGGSTLAVQLEPADAQPGGVSQPARGVVLENVGLPHPALAELLPGKDYEERAIIHVAPLVSTAGQTKPLWGHYHLSVAYAAKFSNADEIFRNLAVTVWQGEASSNTLDIDLEPAPADAAGSVSGTVANSDRRPLRQALVSLSDQHERLVDQVRTDGQGRFSFSQLPFGLYWVTARREDSTADDATFQHVDLTAGAPAGSLELLMLPREVYQSKQLLHKPVLFRVTSAGHPAANVLLEVTWSTGTVLENVKGETSDDGTIALDLLPGRNYVTLKQRGCPNSDARVDVAQGGGIDDGTLTLDCSRR